MAYSLLQILALDKLPVVVSGGEDVDAVHILMLAGHVEGKIAKAVRTTNGWMHPTATVTRITQTGKRMLMHFPASRHQLPRSSNHETPD